MIRIVTMEREYGAGGSAIAQKLAERLHWKLWDTELTAEIARMARCDKVQWRSWRSASIRCFTA